MVSVNPPPTDDFFLDPLSMSPLPGLGSTADDLNKKIRKPYTITKSRESWTEQEHDKFLEALQLFDRDWKKIEAFVGSKTVIQIRSHAQKYFLKVQKNGTSEHVPPPRPKRKAAHPYPQKASKNAPLLPQATARFQSSSCLLEPGYGLMMDASSMLRNSASNVTMSSLAHSSVPTVNMSHATRGLILDDMDPVVPMIVNNYCCSNSECPPGTWPTCETTDHGTHGPPLQATPDFAQVYSFIGSVFDPNTSGHLQKLKEMDPINVEAVVLLMKNLSVNLSSPDFEDHKRLLSTHDVIYEEAKPSNANSTIRATDSHKTPSRPKVNDHQSPIPAVN